MGQWHLNMKENATFLSRIFEANHTYQKRVTLETKKKTLDVIITKSTVLPGRQNPFITINVFNVWQKIEKVSFLCFIIPKVLFKKRNTLLIKTKVAWAKYLTFPVTYVKPQPLIFLQ